MLSKSKEHLVSVNESYTQHMGFALRFGLCCFKAGFMAATHALIPAFFQTGASDEVKRLCAALDPECRDL